MIFEFRVTPLPIDTVERIVRAYHHPEFTEYEHTYVCSHCRETWPCTIVKVAATALHYAGLSKIYEERLEEFIEWDLDRNG